MAENWSFSLEQGSDAPPTTNSNGNCFRMEKPIHSEGLPLSLTHCFGEYTGWWLHRAGGQWRSASFWKNGEVVCTNAYLCTQVTTCPVWRPFPVGLAHRTQTAARPQHGSQWPLAARCGTYAQEEQAPIPRVEQRLCCGSERPSFRQVAALTFLFSCHHPFLINSMTFG